MPGDQDDPDRGEEGSESPPRPPQLQIDSPRALLGEARQIIERLTADPAALRMLPLNPVLAFKEVGVELSPAMADHVLRTIRHPPAVRTERDALEASLEQALGETPRPTNEDWLAHFLFEKLNLTPLDQGSNQPVYASSIDAEAIQRLAALAPSTPRLTPLPHGEHPSVLQIGGFKSANNLDLHAPTPSLPPAQQRPTQVSVEGLWFYKDQHPLAMEVLRLAQLQLSALPVHSGARFRQIQSGEVTHPLLVWIRSTTFNVGKRT